MASSLVHRVERLPPHAKTYGFHKVGFNDVERISVRLSSCHTASSKTTELERSAFCQGLKTQIASCQRATLQRAALGMEFGVRSDRAGKRLTEVELDKLVRRLQRPTTSYQIGRVYNHKVTDHHVSIPTTIAAAHTVNYKQRQTQIKVARPTAASRLKKLGFCGFCDDDKIDKDLYNLKFRSEIGEETPQADKSELNEMLKRVTTPTKASSRGSADRGVTDSSPCPWLPGCLREELHASGILPLISGLPRSRNVSEITLRLQTGGHRGRDRTRAVPLSTPYNVYDEFGHSKELTDF